MISLEFKKNFWDKKILKWEDEKYVKNGFLFDTNSSLKYRMNIARNILSKIGKDKVILEIGCGSGMLLDPIEKIGIKKYIGIDISKAAIDKAKLKASQLSTINAHFINADINEIEIQNVDICFSIGLLDWITIDEISSINEKISSKYVFHSFSEKKLSILQVIHALFVFFKYGYKSNGYKPKYYRQHEILRCFYKDRNNISFFRNSALSFGTIIFQLPLKLTEKFLEYEK